MLRQVAPAEIRPAVALLLAPADRPASASQIGEFIHFAGLRSISLEQIWIAEQGARMLWALLPVVSAGRTMLLFTPPQVAPDVHSAAAALVAQVCDHFARDIHLAQVLIDPGLSLLRGFFASQGFAQIAELIYLQAQVHRAAKAPPLATGMRWVHYSPQTHALFGRAILQSYRDSLDCPALSGLRDIEDIIAGHKATGEFQPDLWSLLLQDEQPRGVLLLSRIAHSDAMELVYLGLTPESRGHGLGSLLLRQAMHMVLTDRRRRLTLAVDAANHPALNLYFRHGMQRITSKIAMIRDLRRPAPTEVE